MNEKPNTLAAALAHASEKAAVLAEALPYMRRYAGKTILVKYGGHAMGDAVLGDSFARDVVLLKQVGINPIVVHGGGPQIGQMLERLKIKSAFVDGLRVTDQATVEIVEMVLSGSINKQLAAAINRAGGTAIGLSGKDGALIRARKLERRRRDPDSNIERLLDLGFVGEVERVNAAMLDGFARSDIIPVIAPIGVGAAGETFNINADTVAGAVAAAVRATRFLLLTDVAGVLDREKRLLPELSRRGARHDRRWHDQRRHDPQGRDLPRSGGWRRRGRRHPRWTHGARDPARTLHRGRRNADPRSRAGRRRHMKVHAPPAIAIAALDHVVLRVADLERATAFYRDVLLCPVEKWQPELGLLQLRAGSALIDLVTLDGKLGREGGAGPGATGRNMDHRSEEHTSEL